MSSRLRWGANHVSEVLRWDGVTMGCMSNGVQNQERKKVYLE